MKQCFFTLTALFCFIAGCGPDAKLQTKYHFPRVGVQHEGDTLYIVAKADVMIIGDLCYSVGNGKWIPVENKQNLKAKKLKGTDDNPEFGINIILLLPRLSAADLKFKLTATFPDGSKADKIIEIEEIIDSVVPESKVTFDPFSL